MDTSLHLERITNRVVRAAIEALQAGDHAAWRALFAANVVFTDDGNPRDFETFTAGSVGHEKFLTIDTVERDGCDVYGDFDAGQWGRFPVFFKFTVEDEGITRLDIGQAKAARNE